MSFDTFGENAFGDLFSELTPDLVQMGGGTLQIVRPGEGERKYDRVTNTWTEPEPRIQNIAFVPESLKGGHLSHVGAVQIEASDLAGIVAGADLGEELVSGSDRLRWNGKTYLLKSVEKIQAGDVTVAIRLLGGLTSDG